jgi:NAD dependent epimerase/dehydratase
MDFSGKKILVTGASGFIGSHLVERLVAEGADVRALFHYNSRSDYGLLELLDPATLAGVEIIPGDLKDGDGVRRAVKGCEIVFHLGALIAIPYSYRNPNDFVQANVVGTANVLNAALEYGVERLVHTSTSETYGTAQYQPIDEAHPLVAQSPYSASKIAADKLAESYHFSFDLPVATIRPFNTYGPRQSARAVVPTIIAQALAGGTIRLGSTSPKRDFNYVGDTVSGFLAVASNEAAIGEVINIGSGRTVSIQDVIDEVGRILGRTLEVETDPARIRPDKSEVGLLLADNRKAADLLGWRPEVKLEEGLRRTVEWIAAHAARYKPQIYNV